MAPSYWEPGAWIVLLIVVVAVAHAPVAVATVAIGGFVRLVTTQGPRSRGQE